MHRRFFLSLSAAAPAFWSARSLLAQPVAGPRAALVIGVDKAGNLPVLRAAASGARLVAAWLGGEGFDVKLFVDEGRPVRSADLYDAVSAAVARGNLAQLVIYFAGHGFVNSYAEYWMLSLAPDNPNEAVSLRESIELARLSAIPNVVFISDACRSRADSLSAELVRGSMIFPSTRTPPTSSSEVDQFLATLIGNASFEAPVAQSAGEYAGIYTSAFLAAFRNPDPSMVRDVNGIHVVTNAKLKGYLTQQVPRLAERASIHTTQHPDTRIESGESSYIGRAASAAPPTVPASGPGAVPGGSTASLVDVAGVRLNQIGLATVTVDRGRVSDASISSSARASGFDSAREALVLARGLPAQLASPCGFAITGQRLEAVVGGPRIRAEFANGAGAVPSALVQIDLQNNRAGSVALRFADGTGTVLGALQGFIGNVLVDAGGVNSVSYVPSRANPLFSEYAHNEARIAELHAMVATAARFGAFRIEGSRETRNRAASQMADRIRILKGIDPTLGIYAAYAYSDAGLLNQVRSVMGYMRGDLGVDLFDVALLAGTLAGRLPGDPNGAVPFVPMLAQGWSLLRVRDVKLPDAVLSAQDHLRPGLWTTLAREGMRMVEGALREGKLR